MLSEPYRLLCFRSVILITLAGLVRPALCSDITPKTAAIPSPKKLEVVAGPFLLLNEKTLAEQRQELAERERHLERHHEKLQVPKSGSRVKPLLTSTPFVGTPTALNSTKTSVKMLLDRVLTIHETGAVVSTTCEPSLALRGDEVLLTGNWFASFSTNATSAASSFKAIRPGDLFPSPSPDLPFCCDQVAYYDPKDDLMLWVLQYEYNGDGDFFRLAVAQGDDIKKQNWRYYDLSPQIVGHYTKEWFDFPACGLSRKYFYLTTNSYATCCGNQLPFVRATAIRIPLDKLAAYQGFDLEYFDTKDFTNGDAPVGSLCPTQGASDTMYLGAHANDSTLRVFTWPDAGPKVVTNDVSVTTWSSDDYTAPNPQGGDWLARLDGRITAGWVSKKTVGFGWCAAKDEDYRFPHVRIAILDPLANKVVDEPHIYSPDFAYAYPAAAPSVDGNVGITLHFGGDTINPSVAVGILQPGQNGHGTWDLATVVAGKAFPPKGFWGDFLTMRLDGKNQKNWAAATFVQDNNGRPQVSYHIFTTK